MTAFLNFAPHRHVQRHLTLGHEQTAAHGHAYGLAQLYPVALSIGAVAIHRLSAGIGALRESRLGEQAQYQSNLFHASNISTAQPLTKALSSATETL